MQKTNGNLEKDERRYLWAEGVVFASQFEESSSGDYNARRKSYTQLASADWERVCTLRDSFQFVLVIFSKKCITNNLLVDKSLIYLRYLHIFFVRFHFKDRLKSKCKNSKELCNAILS